MGGNRGQPQIASACNSFRASLDIDSETILPASVPKMGGGFAVWRHGRHITRVSKGIDIAVERCAGPSGLVAGISLIPR